MPDPDLIWAFIGAIKEATDAEEFERLLLGTERSFDECMRRISTGTSVLTLRLFLGDGEPTALEELRASKYLEELQADWPAQWEQAVMSVAVDA